MESKYTYTKHQPYLFPKYIRPRSTKRKFGKVLGTGELIQKQFLIQFWKALKTFTRSLELEGKAGFRLRKQSDLYQLRRTRDTNW